MSHGADWSAELGGGGGANGLYGVMREEQSCSVFYDFQEHARFLEGK